jgi:hypothetical protein
MFRRSAGVLQTLLINGALVALFVPLLYQGLLQWAAWRISRACGKCALVNQKAYLIEDGPGYNPANLYWAVRYDCTDSDVEITGIVPQARYFSLVAYDRYTLPLPNALLGEMMVKDATGRFTAYLTVQPGRHANEIDVSASPRGIVLIRIGCPEAVEELAGTPPAVRPVPRPCTG